MRHSWRDTIAIGQGEWYSGLVWTDPASDTVIVDTGPLDAGCHLFALAGSSSVAWVYDIEHRNAANDANVDVQRRRPGAGNEDFPFPNKITLKAGERIRAVLVGTITGQNEIQASIFKLEMS